MPTYSPTSGICKAGFGSGLGILAVPLLALTVPASQVAAIMLPILCELLYDGGSKPQ